MKRTALAGMLLAAVCGCVSTEGGRYGGETWNSGGGSNGMTCSVGPPPTVPGVQGPWGQPVPVRGPYVANAPSGEAAAKAMIATHMPLELVQQVGYTPGGPMPGRPGTPGAGLPPGAMGLPPGSITPPGVPGAPGMPGAAPPGAVAAVGALTHPHAGQFATARTSVRFLEPKGMKISWYAPSADGKQTFSSPPLEVPGSYNFVQAAIYRLKLSDIPELPNRELYPTLEVVPASARAATFLAHSSVPVSFTSDDFRQVEQGNYVVKVIYLPDPQYQDIAVTGTGELISTQLEPGVDPIAEACKRGSILAVVRLGNIDLELKHSPSMTAPPPGGPHHGHGHGMAPPGAMPPGMMPQRAGAPGPMMPYGMAGPGGPMMGPNGPMMPPPPGAMPGLPPGRTPVGQVPTPAHLTGQK
jgi:hypothetical protein